jgi:fucose permease
MAPDAMAGWRLSFLFAGWPGLLFAVMAVLMPEPTRGGSEAVSDAPPPKSALRRLLKTPAWRIDTVGTTLMTFTLGGLAFWMPSFLQRVHGMEEGEAGVVFGGVTVVAGLVGTLVGGHLGDRAQARNDGGYFSVSGWGLLLGAPFVVACATLGWLPLVFVAAFVAEFFLFLNTGPLNAALVSCVPATLRATAVAVNVFMIHALGDAISPPLMGFISDVVGPMLASAESAPVVGLRLAIAITAIPVAVGGIYLIRGARRMAEQSGGLEAHDDA